MTMAPIKMTMTQTKQRRTQKKSGAQVKLCHQHVRLNFFPFINPTNFSPAKETGEEGETSTWIGRAKLYKMDREGDDKGWKERGIGNIKLNVTLDEPRKARFVLRADGTHRLILNAAITKQTVFGADSKGAEPKDGRLLFNAPNAEGELEMHLLKVRADVELRIRGHG